MPQSHSKPSRHRSSPRHQSSREPPNEIHIPAQPILRPRLAESLTTLPDESNLANLRALIKDLTNRHQWMLDNTPRDCDCSDGSKFSAITLDFDLISDANLQRQHRELVQTQQDLRKKFRFLAMKYRDVKDNLESILRVADKPDLFQKRMAPIVLHIQSNRVKRAASASSQGST